MPTPPSLQRDYYRTLLMPALVSAALLALAWLVYQPGLSGAFLFDDLGSLPALGATGPVTHWATFWRYITSGTADPTGRPLALLSFLLDGRNWPTDPHPFKVTNVVLHLLNGALLTAVLWMLGSALISPSSGETRQSEWLSYEPGNRCIAFAALFGTGCWLLHPLLVSTTLYVVQRETMLSTSFVLIGMLGWMASRRQLAAGNGAGALAGMTASTWLCTLLAVLCKANGALLPLLLLLVEWIVLAPRLPMPSLNSERLRRTAVVVLLILPSALLAVYLIQALPGQIRSAPDIRGWTIGQRLLTEPRVLTDYLRLLFIPQAYSRGLFNDDFAVSADWLHPISTLPCALFILALVGAGFALRKRHPAIALALLFYFAGQSMESGWIPLELYFEHRNYLPAMLLFWPIGLALGLPGPWRRLRGGAAVVVVVFLAILTTQRTSLWGNAFQQAQFWAATNPGSARAQTSAALYDLQTGRPGSAVTRLQAALPMHSDDLQIPLNLITAQCRLGVVPPQTLDAARSALSTDRVGGSVAFHWFGDALASTKKHACRGLDDADLQTLLDAAWRNPHWRPIAGMRQNLYHLQGTLELAHQLPHQALRNFDLALEQAPNPATALSQAAALGSAGYPCLGLDHLDHFAGLPKPQEAGLGMARVHAWVLQRQGYWRHEIADLRYKLSTVPHSPCQKH